MALLGVPLFREVRSLQGMVQLSPAQQWVMIGFQVAGVVLILRAIYLAWSAIQDVHERTSAGKAVGFLFIPLFSLYWQFVVTAGFAERYNELCERYEINVARQPKSLYLWLTIAWFALGLGSAFSPAWSIWIQLASNCCLWTLLAIGLRAYNNLVSHEGHERIPRPPRRPLLYAR